MEPLVSVLLPCRNGQRTVGAAIASLLDQTLENFEIIFLNDGSTDSTLQIVQAFKDPRIRVCGDTSGRGLPYRLNEGVRLARGQFIARMDADDLCFPSRLQKQVDFLTNNQSVDLVGCRAVVFRDDGSVIGLLPFAATHLEICARTWRNIPLPHPSWMGRREWFIKNPYRIPEVHRAEDQELLLRTCNYSTFACMDDVLLAYRQGDFQLRRTLVARRALWLVQIRHFWAQRAHLSWVRSTAISLVKVAIDCLAALPGLQRIFFFRMHANVPEKLAADFAARFAQCSAGSA